MERVFICLDLYHDILRRSLEDVDIRYLVGIGET